MQIVWMLSRAIGIARVFNFGGFKNNPIYIPGEEPKLNLSKRSIQRSQLGDLN